MLGLIVDAPEGNDADIWALVVEGIVVNMIVASASFIHTIAEDYDYLVDVTVGGQYPVGIGYIYDSDNDVFSTPPEDFNQELVDAMTNLAGSLATALAAKDNVSDSGEMATDLSNADTSALTGDALTNLWPTIVTYIQDNSS